MKSLLSLLLIASSCWLLQCRPADPQGTTDTTAQTETTVAPQAPYQDVDAAAFRELMGDENVVILDVRTPEEIAQGKIDGAIELDIQDEKFIDRIKELDQSKTYLVYCQSGGRSSRACDMMSTAGFKQLYNLQGGYGAWAK